MRASTFDYLPIGHLGIPFKSVQNSGALRMAGGSVDVGLPHPHRVLPQRKDVVREYDDLVAHLQRHRLSSTGQQQSSSNWLRTCTDNQVKVAHGSAMLSLSRSSSAQLFRAAQCSIILVSEIGVRVYMYIYTYHYI